MERQKNDSKLVDAPKSNSKSDRWRIGTGRDRTLCKARVSIITTTIFNIYTYILAYICLYTIDEGVKIGGKLLKDIRFVDDQAMVADPEKGLQEIMDKLVEVGRKYDMKINVKKTKTMRML